MTRLALVRYAVLILPLAAVGLACAPRRGRREAGALLLAFLAALVGVAALDRLARLLGWWTFAAVEGGFDGLPVDAWLGWAVLWGPLPLALGWLLPRFRLLLPLALVAWLDLLVMPALSPLLVVAPGWWVGELAGLALVAVPAVLLGHWTVARRRLYLRATGQLALFAGLMVWLLPSVAMSAGSGSWRPLLAAPRWQLSLLGQVFLLVATPGLVAVIEFAVRGGGTPYPWDPPIRLVTTGPYAYLANPMQASGVGLMLVLAVGLRNWSVLAAAMLAGAFSEAVAEQHERADLRRRHGGAWAAYRRQVRRWIPRWQPYVSTPATLYIDLGCVPCRELGAMFRRLRPTGLALADARNHPEPLTRVRYERDDGLRADGLAAVARAAEHVDAACALLGWVARLPVLSWVLARFADRLCFGPRLRSGARPGQNPPSGSNPQRADSRRLDSGRLDSGRADSGPGGRKNRWRTTPGGD